MHMYIVDVYIYNEYTNVHEKQSLFVLMSSSVRKGCAAYERPHPVHPV